MIEKINEEVFNKLIKYSGGNTIRVSYVIADIYLKKLIHSGYEILGYDGLIINNKRTLSPINLVFDFCREGSPNEEKNIMALESIIDLYKKAIQEGYDGDDIYVEIVFKGE